MTAKTLLTRIFPAAAVTAGLLFAAPAADAADKKSKKVTATIALGDKRPKKTQARASVACSDTDVMPTAENLDEVRAAILCLHNKIRAEKGLPLLKSNAKLAKAALGHSTEMVKQGFFDHTNLDGDTFVDRVLSAGYVKRNAGWSLGENLAWGTGALSTAASIMDSWMDSPGHKANILKKTYRELGIGIRLGVPSDEGVGATVTADFGVKL